ncbi:uncharacterized protein C11orf16 homolog [Boleophthalmus pectinirostris]|uniref:uncharacterized protein C11orf16 homolog n=1 Tax=Boleophthalmus pectinirostris TaxID=150288 RepID=UPI00242A3575|nr:uncharacterized protein C11orf16 homolog [Boleophthalmus pectinirostris]
MWSCENSMYSKDQSEHCSPVTCLRPTSCPSSPLNRSRVVPSVSHLSSLQNSYPDEFFSGVPVLARNQQDGFYHQATVVHKVQSCRGLWVVQFYGSRQLLSALDMVQFDQSRLKCLRPGDTVLCPISVDYSSHHALGPGTRPGSEPGLQFGLGSERFGPGRVVSVTKEISDPLVRVLLWDSHVSISPLSSLCPLPQNLFYRISRELFRVGCQSCACYHSDRTTCPSLPKELHRGQRCPTLCYNGDCITCPSPPPCLCCCLWNQTSAKTGLTWSEPGLIESEQGIRSDSGFCSDQVRTREEQEEEEEEEEEEEKEGGSEFKRTHQRRERPPWRYWRRTGPEPQHKKPGGAVTRRPPQFSYVMFPSPQSRSSTNHSAVFQLLANHTRGGGLFKYRPHPPQNPANQRPPSAAFHRPRSVV